MVVRVDVHGVWGGSFYERHSTGDGVELMVPFQTATLQTKRDARRHPASCRRTCKERFCSCPCRNELRKLGLGCAYSERYWKLDAVVLAVVPDIEEDLRHLLETGELPAADTPAQREKRRRGEDESDEAKLEPVQFHGGLVTMLRERDGFVTLEGMALRHIE